MVEKMFKANLAICALSLLVAIACGETKAERIDAQLELHWLASNQAQPTLSGTEGSTPVYGWLTRNSLDHSLLFCDTGGKSLGSIGLVSESLDSIVQTARWFDEPGSEPAVFGPILARVREAIETQLNGYLESLERGDARQQLDGRSQAILILIGRPLAVVRVSVGFDKSVAGANNTQMDQTSVRIAGGVVGFWIEDESAATKAGLLGTFHVPLRTAPDTSAFDANTTVKLDAKGTSRVLILLIDPMDPIRASSEVGGTANLQLLPKEYQMAHKEMAAQFLNPSMPKVGTNSEVAHPLPQEPGYQWRWEQAHRSEWKQAPLDASVPVNSEQQGQADSPREDSQQGMAEGWLKLDG
jgi:hypothetical protein